jgi:hypothetical protein
MGMPAARTAKGCKRKQKKNTRKNNEGLSKRGEMAKALDIFFIKPFP